MATPRGKRTSVSHHALERSINSLTFGMVRDIQKAEARRLPNRAQEGEQQFQIPISGIAGLSPIWVNKELSFAWTFYNATGQRDSDLIEPQMYWGLKIDSPNPVFVHAVVMKWDKKDADEIEGATIAVGAFNPTGRKTRFKGHLHVTFQGFGALGEYEVEDIP